MEEVQRTHSEMDKNMSGLSNMFDSAAKGIKESKKKYKEKEKT